MGRKFSDFKSEAKRRQQRSGGRNEPFVIDLEDGSQIKVDFPDAQTYLALGKVKEGDTLGVLQTMFANNPRDFNRLLEELDGQPVQLLSVFVEEMWDFWNEDLRKSAGKVAE